MTWLSKILLLQVLLLTNSCTGNILWHSYANVDADGWHDYDTVSFDLPETFAEGKYSMDIELRTTPAYPYSNLCIVRQMKFSNPAGTHRDTILIHTSDDGQSLAGQGTTLQSFAQPAPDFHLSKGQRVSILLYHAMTCGTVPDVTDIGIKVKARE